MVLIFVKGEITHVCYCGWNKKIHTRKNRSFRRFVRGAGDCGNWSGKSLSELGRETANGPALRSYRSPVRRALISPKQRKNHLAVERRIRQRLSSQFSFFRLLFCLVFYFPPPFCTARFDGTIPCARYDPIAAPRAPTAAS